MNLPPISISPFPSHSRIFTSFCSQKSRQNMPVFTASFGFVSRTNVSFLSGLFACDNSNNHQVLNFPLLSSGNSAKRAAFLSPKVTVSSGSAAKADGVDQIQQQALSPEDVRQARVCFICVDFLCCLLNS